MTLYKYYHPESFDFICVEDGVSLRFSQPEILNDPFDSNLKNSPFNNDEIQQIEKIYSDLNFSKKEEVIRKITNENPESIQEIINKSINSTYGILSLSKEEKSRLMWAYYSEKHTGFMISFKKLNLKISEFSSGDVFYEKSRPDYKNMSEADIEKSLFIKDEDWHHESEYRIFAKLEHIKCKKTDPNGYPIHSTILDPRNIDRIVLGARSDATLERKVKFWVRQYAPHVMILKAFPCKNSYSLNYNPVS